MDSIGSTKRSVREIGCSISNMHKLIRFMMCWILSIVGGGFVVVFLVNKISGTTGGDTIKPVREVSRAPEPVSQNGLNLVRNLIIENSLNAIDQVGLGTSEFSLGKIYGEVDSKELSSEYSYNESAADQKYKGKKWIVSGTVQGTRKDISGAMVVAFPGRDRLLGARAELASKSKGFLGVIGKGARVELVCSVKGVFDGLVSLDSCEPRQWVAESHAGKAIEKLNAWLLHGGHHPFENDGVAKGFFILYASAKYLPESHPCKSRDDYKKCIDMIDSAFSKNLDSAKANDYEVWRKWLQLPEA